MPPICHQNQPRHTGVPLPWSLGLRVETQVLAGPISSRGMRGVGIVRHFGEGQVLSITLISPLRASGLVGS